MTQPGDERLLDAVAEVARDEHVQLMSHALDESAFAELSEAELQRLASAVSQQLGSEPPRAQPGEPRPPAAAGQRGLGRRLGWLAAAAALLGGLWLVQRLPSGAEQLEARAPAIDRQLTLPDGSTLALGAQTEARVVTLDPHEVRVQLDRGSVECEVAHNPERRFVVATGALEVVVKGTRFSVSSGLEATAPEQVVVSVEQGLVEVRQAPEHVLALLGAGQRWSSDGRSSPPLSLPPPAPPAPPLLDVPSPPVPQPAAPEPGAARPTAAQRAVPGAAARERSEPAAGATRDSSSAPSARQLFERADAERLAGRSRQAAEAFDELRRHYPNDTRAGYAAFMLGRIRLDSLGDPGGAAEAFEFALAHAARDGSAAGSGFFLEDAAARHVEALDGAGRREECRAARERFSRSFPRAVRAALVKQLCER